MWWDEQISQGLKQWDVRDKMTCGHAELGKEAKCPYPLGTPLDYMESCGVFKSDKMSEYGLCHFYQVGLSGDFPKFPTPCEPTTNDHLHRFLENARECSWPNLLVVHSQDMVTVVCLLRELHVKDSLWHLKMETDAEASDKSKRKLLFCLFCQYLGSNNLCYHNHIICTHYNASYGCGKCLKEVFSSGQWLKVHMRCCKGLKAEAVKEKPATSHAKGASSSFSPKKKKHQTKSQQSDLQPDTSINHLPSGLGHKPIPLQMRQEENCYHHSHSHTPVAKNHGRSTPWATSIPARNTRCTSLTNTRRRRSNMAFYSNTVYFAYTLCINIYIKDIEDNVWSDL